MKGLLEKCWIDEFVVSRSAGRGVDYMQTEQNAQTIVERGLPFETHLKLDFGISEVNIFPEKAHKLSRNFSQNS